MSLSLTKPLIYSLACLSGLAMLGLAFLGYRSITESPYRGQIVESAVFSRDGKSLFGTGYLVTPQKTEFYLYAWDAATGQLRWRKPLLPEGVGELTISHSGEWLLTTQYGVLTLYSTTSGTLEKSFRFPEPKNVLSTRHNSPAQFTADDKEILVCNLNNTLLALDSTTGKPLRQLRHRPDDQVFALSPDGKRLVLHEHSTLLMLDPKTEAPLLTQSTAAYSGLKIGVFPIWFFPDGQRVRVADQVWNPATRTLRPLNRGAHNSEYEQFITSPDLTRQVTLEYRGARGEHYPLGRITNLKGGTVLLEGKTGW
jgi:WD40 repeat protein